MAIALLGIGSEGAKQLKKIDVFIDTIGPTLKITKFLK